MGKQSLKKGINVTEIAYYEVTREYKCDLCDEQYYVVCKKTHPVKKFQCPMCKSELQSLLNSTLFFLEDIKTVGQLADKNTRKMGHYEREEKTNKLELDQFTAKEKAGINVENLKRRKEEIDKINKINKMTKAQKVKYITHGQI